MLPTQNSQLVKIYYLIILFLVTTNTIISFEIQILRWLNLDNIFKYTDTNRTFLSDWTLYIQAAQWHLSGLNVYSSEFVSKHGEMGFLYSPLVLNILSNIISITGAALFKSIGVFLFVILYPAIVALFYIDILKKINPLANIWNVIISIIIIFAASIFWFNSIAAGNISGILLITIIYFILISENKYKLYLADFFIILLSLIKPQFSVLILHRTLSTPSSSVLSITFINFALISIPYIYTATAYWGQVLDWLGFVYEVTAGSHDDGLLLMRYINNKLLHRSILGVTVFTLIYIYAIRSYIKLRANESLHSINKENITMLVVLSLLIISPRYNEYDVFVIYLVSILLIIRNKVFTSQLLFLISLFETVRLVKIGMGGNYYYPSASSYFMIYIIYLGIKSSLTHTFSSKMINNKEVAN